MRRWPSSNPRTAPLQGGLVKIALGGALYSMGQYVTDVGQATQFAEAMQVGPARWPRQDREESSTPGDRHRPRPGWNGLGR